LDPRELPTPCALISTATEKRKRTQQMNFFAVVWILNNFKPDGIIMISHATLLSFRLRVQHRVRLASNADMFQIRLSRDRNRASANKSPQEICAPRLASHC